MDDLKQTLDKLRDELANAGKRLADLAEKGKAELPAAAKRIDEEYRRLQKLLERLKGLPHLRYRRGHKSGILDRYATCSDVVLSVAEFSGALVGAAYAFQQSGMKLAKQLQRNRKLAEAFESEL